jgi:hypothetical protein
MQRKASRTGNAAAHGMELRKPPHLLRQKSAKTEVQILATNDVSGFAASIFHSFSQLVRNISTDEDFGFSAWFAIACCAQSHNANSKEPVSPAAIARGLRIEFSRPSATEWRKEGRENNGVG